MARYKYERKYSETGRQRLPEYCPYVTIQNMTYRKPPVLNIPSHPVPLESPHIDIVCIYIPSRSILFESPCDI